DLVRTVQAVPWFGSLTMSGSEFRAFLRMDSKLTERCTNEASSKSLEIFSKQSQGKYERACDRIGLGEKSRARLLLPDFLALNHPAHALLNSTPNFLFAVAAPSRSLARAICGCTLPAGPQ